MFTCAYATLNGAVVASVSTASNPRVMSTRSTSARRALRPRTKNRAHYIAMQSTGKESLEELAVKFKGTRLGTIVTTVNVRREEYRNRLAKLNEREDAFNERECQIASTGTDAAPHDKLAF